jgi:hypothetical protein
VNDGCSDETDAEWIVIRRTLRVFLVTIN